MTDMVTVQPRGKHYDRLVADVVLPDGKLLNHERGKRGLWADKRPVERWLWRKRDTSRHVGG
jgi:endonuclease YncB( thermonuclease family)